ncbi:MAG: TauD/TfdA dioxygenase family protein [Lautropia sp.]
MAIEIKRLSDLMGGEIVSPIDLRQPLSDEQAAEVNRALHTYQVLVIPGQKITPAQYVGFASRIGRPQIHMNSKFWHPDKSEILVLSNVIKDGKPIGLQDGGIHWHTDFSFMELPAKATMLYSVQTPARGGNTLFSSMYTAYETLGESMKRRIDGMKVVHRYEIRQSRNDDPRAITAIRSTPNYEEQGSAVHPLVYTHPATGRRALYAPVSTASQILGLPADESGELLDELKEHVTRKEVIYSQYYRPDDIVIWDNPSLIHAATITPPEYPRTLHRITVMMDTKPWAGESSPDA